LGYTGLNVEVDRILEIACIITDGNLSKTLEVFSYLLVHMHTVIYIYIFFWVSYHVLVIFWVLGRGCYCIWGASFVSWVSVGGLPFL